LSQNGIVDIAPLASLTTLSVLELAGNSIDGIAAISSMIGLLRST
jgi:hypothetical protein